jgi:hypothetical protein
MDFKAQSNYLSIYLLTGTSMCYDEKIERNGTENTNGLVVLET